ncbi:MAG: ribbon-helix-helix domain-containing protein [Candidatus Diapherotrites archaeon]
MEHISIQLDASIARQVEKGMREFNYTTKTEFIRDAIRAKLKELDGERSKKKAWEALFAAKGAFKGKGRFKTDEEFHAWRSGEGSRELEKRLCEQFGIKP